MTQKLYALLVGINEYNYPPSSLNGCVADIERVEAYLQKDQDFEVHIHKLLDAEATKSKIVQGFREHLSQAKAGDTILFYFSGHGCQEAASSVWTSEHDGKLECLVCHNSETQYLLADKELRFLIHELHQKAPQAHIVTLFDCCHSGDNTRNEQMQDSGEDIRERRYGRAFPERAWEEFIFADQLSISDFEGKTISQVLPEGKHIQLAACQSKESAWEVNGQGIFTKNLLEVLERSEGDITYYDLKSRLKFYVKARKPQSPQLYVQGKNNQDFFLTFLGKDRQSKPMYARINRHGDRLVMDMGRLQGISNWNKKVEVESAHGEKVALEIQEVKNDRSYLTGTAELLLQLEGQTELKGYVSGLATAPFHLYIKDEDGDPKLLNQLKEQLQKVDYLQLVENPLENDYTLVIRDDSFRITSDYDYIRPLIETLPTHETDALLSDLEHISHWLHTKAFQNEEPSFFAGNPYITVEVYQEQSNGTWQLLDQLNDSITLNTQKEEDAWGGNVKIKLKNTSTRDLYCALLYLPNNFGAISLLDQDSMMIPKKGELWAWESEGRAIPLRLEEHTLDYNWEAELHHLKVMVSTKDNLDTQVFLLDERPLPKTLNATMGMSMRGLLTRKKGVDDWTTMTIDLSVPNPMYNKVTEHKLQQLLAHPVLNEYAVRLYFDVDLSQKLRLKEEIEIVEDGEIRGDFMKENMMKLANRIIKNQRRRRFKRHIEKYPERELILSEGDSWFQHPLLIDIIDHLAHHYNIYGVGDAGGELADYLSSGDLQRALAELKANHITESRPLKYFLLSGGGNDIIGQEMKQFLRDGFDAQLASNHPKHYLLPSFEEKVNELMTYIQDICIYFQNHSPQTQVLMHTYDYIIPQLGTGWVGKHMKNAGITAANERQKLLNHMMNTYHDALQQLSEQFPNFQVVDLRSTLKDYHWFDEIHPSSVGFGMVAEKVREVMNTNLL